jgi:hypothetical protein
MHSGLGLKPVSILINPPNELWILAKTKNQRRNSRSYHPYLWQLLKMMMLRSLTVLKKKKKTTMMLIWRTPAQKKRQQQPLEQPPRNAKKDSKSKPI